MKKYFVFLLSVVLVSSTLANSNKVTPQETEPAFDNTEATAMSPAEGPILSIKSNAQTRKFTRRELLGSPYLKKIVVEKDPAYKMTRRTYSAIPASQLFGEFKINVDTTIAFFCLDGFSAPISAERLLNSDSSKSIAYLAIEMPTDPWPPLKSKGGKSVGPYYLIWENPEKSHISIEEWPFQLAGFEIKGSLAEQFPHTVPDKAIKDSDPIMKGYKSFMKNCFACHTMNGEGLAQIGPDLNIPYNPTEYFKPEYLEILVRKPTGLRKWPLSKMSAFSKENLSEEEYGWLMQYLKYMAKHKTSGASL